MALTGLFLATLAVWARDTSEGQGRTRRFLEKRLAHGARWMNRVPGGPGGDRGHEASLQR
ncbi:hypothetical protein [Halomonas campaniensis]|uniref:hypothetical protein n=1 Tax=Halomonas campaniensis TaxID=213554 RepID=UPI0035648EE7